MFQSDRVVHLQVDTIVALSYLKNWGSYHKILLNLTKELWEYLLANGIAIIV